MREIPYDREAALAYADRWALSRNPAYLDFSNLGGDCTNFISQCLYAGIGVMNYTPDTGWYYINGNRKAPAWTAARYLHRFLLNNQGVGPYAREMGPGDMVPGDLVQLMNASGVFYHSLLIMRIVGDQIFIATHTLDAYMRPLSSYNYYAASFMKIVGGRA